MRVVVVQIAAGTDPEANLATAFGQLGDQDADLIVLPEAVMHDFGPPDLPLGPIAQPVDGPFVAALAAQAKARRSAIVAGMFEQSDDRARPYNTVVLVDSAGDVAATYRKTHLYDSFGYSESARLRQGRPEATVVDLDGFRFGLMTCYDLRFPEHARAMVDAGADVLVIPAAWVRGPLKEDHWATLLRARAIENTVYVVAAAQCGKQYCGRSMVVDPMGIPVAALGEAEGAATALLDGERIAGVRSVNPALRHRRWDVTAKDS
jgi:deaminated glutathione amidase